MMLKVDQMKEIAVKTVEEYLGEKYPGIEVEFESEVDENSVTTEYLMISDHHVMGFRIPVKTLFDKYRNGEDIEKYLKEKLGGFLKEYEIVKEAYAFFDHVKEDFSIAKEYLVPYVFDAEIRATLLENHPYRRIGDIALECYLLYERDGFGMQMSINHDTIQKWGITEDELVDLLFARHQENVYLAGANEMEYCIENEKEPGNLLKTSYKSGAETEYILGCSSLYDYDAAFIFSSAIMKKVADVLKDDFYVISVCTDNVIITPVGCWSGTNRMEELHEKIHQLMVEMEEDRNRLPEQLMMYSRKLGKVVVVTEEEKRQMAG